MVDESPISPPRQRSLAALALTFAVPIGFVTFVYGWLSSFMLNDDVTSADRTHLLVAVMVMGSVS